MNEAAPRAATWAPIAKACLEPELEALIPSLHPGAVSDPIKTDKGYYLMKVSPLEPEILQADQAIRERLRQELLAEKRRKRLDDIFAELRSGRDDSSGRRRSLCDR